MKRLLLLALLFSLGACTTGRDFGPAPADIPSLAKVKRDGQTGQRIYWGGVVVKIENKAAYSAIEIIDRPLNRSGKPRNSDSSNGRFIARVNEFVDPENLKPGRRITVRGMVSDFQPGNIGEYEYHYPVVQVNDYKIWPANNHRLRYPYYGYPYNFHYGLYYGYPHRSFHPFLFHRSHIHGYYYHRY